MLLSNDVDFEEGDEDRLYIFVRIIIYLQFIFINFLFFTFSLSLSSFFSEVDEYEDLFNYYRISSLVLSAYHNKLPNVSIPHAFEVLNDYNDVMTNYGNLDEERHKLIMNNERKEKNEGGADGRRGMKRMLSSPKKHSEIQHSFYVNKGYFPFVDRSVEKRDNIKRKVIYLFMYI
jgi:hypothetical protein